MSCPLSSMPESAPMPMSAVPPSPPWAMTLASSERPSALSATSMPDATLAEFSNSEWIHGTCHDERDRLPRGVHHPVPALIVAGPVDPLAVRELGQRRVGHRGRAQSAGALRRG